MWAENKKLSENYWKFYTIKKFYFIFCVKWTHLLYSLQKHGKNDVEVVEYVGEIWINQNHLEKKLDISNIADRPEYYSSELKKMRCRIQECGKYQPCRIFIKNTLAVEITVSSVKTQAVIFRDKFVVNQHDKVLRKQQSLGLRLKK